MLSFTNSYTQQYSHPLSLGYLKLVSAFIAAISSRADLAVIKLWLRGIIV